MKSKIESVIEKLFFVKKKVSLTIPDKKFGDYSTNIAFQLSRELKDSPINIANKIIDELNKEKFFREVKIAGNGFINITIDAKKLNKILEDTWNSNYGHNNIGEGKTVVVEYPSPNIAKPYSVGHLRPSTQGWAIKRLMEVSGWKVITDNHIGDYGSPFGIWVAGYLLFSNEILLQKDGVYELGRIYIETKKALKEEKEKGENKLANEVQDWLLKLESKDQTAIKYSKLFNEISLKHIHKVMDRLKIDTEYELGEAFFAEKGKEIVGDLLKKNIAIQNEDGSVIIKLDEQGIKTPLLILKSNGAALYSTTDIATLYYRYENWKPDRIIHVVGMEQKFYFEQLFAMAKRLQINIELIHYWFGTIDQINEDGTREKMSSRKGVVLVEKLLDIANQKARELVKDSNVSNEDVEKIALGAIKFSDFISDRKTNILFDWNSIFALSGYSGPYIQYSTVRINKILKDNKKILQNKNNTYDYEAEKDIIIKILDYPKVVERAVLDLEPHKIAQYLFELAKISNRYYENIRINESTDEEKQVRLTILSKISRVLTSGLDLLGIEVPKSM